MKSWVLLCCLVQTLVGAEVPARRAFTLPSGVSLESELSVAEVVAIAVANNALLEADLSALGLSRADLLDAGLLRNPSIQTLLPVGLKPFEILLLWPIEDLWQRKKRVLAAQKTLETLSAGLLQNTLNLIRDAKVAHADLLLAQERATTLKESAALRARIATLVERRKNAGDASGVDVSLAQTDAASAAELARRGDGDVAIAQVRLRNVLGLRDQPVAIRVKGEGALPAPGVERDLVESAYANRPDLRAAELQIEASAYRAKWQRARIFNMVLPMLSSKQTGTPLNLRAGPGLQMEFPFFNRNQGQIARADAEVMQSALRYTALRDRVELEVREALARREQALVSLEQLRTQLKPVVAQSIGQTEAAFKNGDASFLNTLESSRQRFDAELRELDTAAALSRAQAELERSLGKK